MAYRRRQGVARDFTYKEEIGSPNPSGYSPPPPLDDGSSSSSASSLAAKAIRASSAHSDSSLSSAYGESALSPRDPKSNPLRSSHPSSAKDSTKYGSASMQSLDEPKRGFWGALTRKAKSIIDDDNAAQKCETPERRRLQMSDTERGQHSNQYQSPENRRKADNPGLQKGLNAITSSLNYIGGTIGNALEEGITIVENRTADIIQETRKLQIRRKGSTSEAQSPALNVGVTRQPPQIQTDVEIQLKASRDVRWQLCITGLKNMFPSYFDIRSESTRPPHPLRLMCDDKSTIRIVENSVQHDRTKHIEIYRHFIEEKLEAKLIEIPYAASCDQVADILTKTVMKPIFEGLLVKLRMHDIYALT